MSWSNYINALKDAGTRLSPEVINKAIYQSQLSKANSRNLPYKEEEARENSIYNTQLTKSNARQMPSLENKTISGNVSSTATNKMDTRNTNDIMSIMEGMTPAERYKLTLDAKNKAKTIKNPGAKLYTDPKTGKTYYGTVSKTTGQPTPGSNDTLRRDVKKTTIKKPTIKNPTAKLYTNSDTGETRYGTVNTNTGQPIPGMNDTLRRMPKAITKPDGTKELTYKEKKEKNLDAVTYEIEQGKLYNALSSMDQNNDIMYLKPRSSRIKEIDRLKSILPKQIRDSISPEMSEKQIMIILYNFQSTLKKLYNQQ